MLKKKNKKIFVFTLATLLILGGTSAVIGVASDGFKNWDTSTWFQDVFQDVKLESKTFIHDGNKKELDVIVPEGATYEVKITKDNQVVTECIEIGDYHYEVKVKIGTREKIFKAELRIIDGSTLVTNQVNNKKMIMKVINSNDSSIELSFTINGYYNSTEYKTRFEFVEDKSPAGEFYSASVDGSAKKVTINNLKPCDKQVKFIIEGKIDASIKGELTIDYRQKVTKEPEINLSHGGNPTVLSNGFSLKVETVAPEFGIGSLPYEGPIKSEENFKTSASWSQAGNVTLDSIVQSSWCDPQTAYSEWKYDNQTYRSASAVASAMNKKIKTYFYGLFNSKNYTFDSTGLTDVLTFQKATHNAGTLQFGNFTVINQFVTEFNKLGSSGYSLNYYFEAYGKSNVLQVRKINLSANYGDIVFDDTAVEF